MHDRSRISIIQKRLMLLCGGAALLTASALVAQPGATSTPRVHADTATLVGHADAVHLRNVEIVEPDGTRRQVNLSLKLKVNDAGTLMVAESDMQPASAQPNAINAFVPGLYAVGKKPEWRLSGPALGAGGRAVWNLAHEDGRVIYTFTTGPIAGHPQLDASRPAVSLPDGYTYGLVGRNDFQSEFVKGRVIALRQVGDTVAVTAFKTEGSDDSERYVEVETQVFNRVVVVPDVP